MGWFNNNEDDENQKPIFHRTSSSSKTSCKQDPKDTEYLICKETKTIYENNSKKQEEREYRVKQNQQVLNPIQNTLMEQFKDFDKQINESKQLFRDELINPFSIFDIFFGQQIGAQDHFNRVYQRNDPQQMESKSTKINFDKGFQKDDNEIFDL